ncbi:glutathione ABC transporter substrate-binding protein [Salisediminibacterium selenitireducens]|uniref:Extracellular solute-binding protein family 5 n=1 Tax=Bacillus selenitireducens (strain ATCC 700615 / DSM 15326 / MLS10) TaxID=439292 RepID=D6Y095_BACIE|nr:glutathione ABC transporter substrate-binding protein [Salisediminibacterium selenitireducens]ADH98486.1 extracellular solute-binding protein family 5 [[Bacillus] selenitireducens MLS10]
MKASQWLTSLTIGGLAVTLAACGGNNDGNEETADDLNHDPVNEAEPDNDENNENAESDGDTQDELTVGIEAEPTSMDPQNTTDGNSATVQSTMFEGLLRFDENMNIVNVLAEDYDYSDDATEITFFLREDVTFHDGTAFDAEAVKENLDFVRDEENGLARSSFFSFIDDVVVEDDLTVTIVSEEPNSAMASYMAHSSASMKSVEQIEMKLDDPDYNLDREGAVGTGPFTFVEWRDGEHVIVERNPDYWNQDELANVEQITFRPVQEAATRVNMLRTGEVDLIFPIPTLNAQELEQEEGIDLYTGPTTDLFYIGMNFEQEKYQDLAVRQAMNHAVDKDGLIAQVLDGYGIVADSAIAPNVYGYAEQPIYEYDVALAEELLEGSDQAGGFEATLWTRNNTEFITVAEYVAIQLEEIGISVNVEPFEAGTLFDMLDAGEGTDLWIGRWSPGTGEADYGLRPNFASDRVPPNFNNSGFYINEELDAMFDEAISTPDEEEALSIYADIQEKIYQDAPWVFLHIPDAIIAKSEDLHGIYILPSGAVQMNLAEFR